MYQVHQASSYSVHHLQDRHYPSSQHHHQSHYQNAGSSTHSHSAMSLEHHILRQDDIQRPPESNARSIPHGKQPAPSIQDAAPDTDFMGKPIHYETGQFAGRTMKAELIEIQKADLGRKYARVDRRPLDPPPVVLFRLQDLTHTESDQDEGRELEAYDEVEMLGLVCTVDLFPVPGPGQAQDASTRSTPGPSYDSGRHHGRDDSRSPPAPSSSSSTRGYSHSTSPSGPLSNLSINDASGSGSSSTSNEDTVIHYVNDYPVTEGSKCTNSLVGATFIQPNLVEYQGKKVLVFVFADLAVKTEGNFILRYRVFDIYAKPKGRKDERVIMQAECYGGPFRVYSTKEFPGLQASTDLTKHLARWGVRLNIRETERRRRKKDEADSPPYTTAALKRKRVPGRGASDEGSDGDD